MSLESVTVEDPSDDNPLFIENAKNKEDENTIWKKGEIQ